MTRTIRFTKMHGAGNDYIYVDTGLYPISDPVRAAIEWSRCHTGIGRRTGADRAFAEGGLLDAHL